MKGEYPFPKRPPKLFDVVLKETHEKMAHSVSSRKTFDAKQGLKRFVSTEPSRVSEAN